MYGDKAKLAQTQHEQDEFMLLLLGAWLGVLNAVDGNDDGGTAPS